MDEILDNIGNEENKNRIYKLASKDKRLANYVIDIIGYYAFSLLVGVLLGVLSLIFGVEDIFLEEQDSLNSKLINLLTGILVITFYYTTLEFIFKGKTLGKLITKTRAVTENNERMDLETTLVRSFYRLVPFEAFSFLADHQSGWHDKWSKTKVIEDDDWREI